MDATTFDGISRNLGAVATRRGFTRLLGGAAALGTAFSGDESQARRQGHGKGRAQVGSDGRRGKKITICYQDQTRTVKKKGYLNKYPGATKGACTPTGNPGATPPPQPCTTFILSGGPNQNDSIVIDDDGSVLNVSTGTFLIIDNNGMAGPINPVVFSGQVGNVLRVRGTDWGGCRSFSPLWVHCLATGQKRQIFTGYSGSGCAYTKGDFLDINITVAL
ncbi:MAG: hypothetical protein KC432_10600 [Thermomicrobiales bacterium]|nr:hypothetical protein [Thermomicrobiales bacterium]